ncbi:cytochrome c-type biogenesis protein [Paraglaciecola aestuariivivens]
MKRVLILNLSLVLLFLSLGALAAQQQFDFEDPKQRQVFLQLTQELRCPKCQNQNIADSDAMIAIDLKRKVYELVKSGKDKEQVIDFMKQRYGDFVHYQPPVNMMTIWLWALPVLFILLAAAGIVISRKSQAKDLDQAQLAKAKALLERDQ